jgi:L-serine dehydratase
MEIIKERDVKIRMDISIFDVVGPIMIGPSSSHTAGAAKLSRVARLIVKEPFTHISFGLHGSFAKTYKGHGTDKALVAGALGLSEDSEALADSFKLAKNQGLEFDFYEIELEGVHENTVKMTLTMLDGSQNVVVGSSIGGGQIEIIEINGFVTNMSLQLPTIVINQYDKKGVISEVSGILAEHSLNIATMKLSRTGKGDRACCIIEIDGEIPEEIEQEIMRNKNIISVKVINI